MVLLHPPFVYCTVSLTKICLDARRYDFIVLTSYRQVNGLYILSVQHTQISVEGNTNYEYTFCPLLSPTTKLLSRQCAILGDSTFFTPSRMNVGRWSKNVWNWVPARTKEKGGNPPDIGRQMSMRETLYLRISRTRARI